MSGDETTFREQLDNDGKLYLYVTASEGIEVTIERYEIPEVPNAEE